MPREKKGTITRIMERRPLTLFAVAYACGAAAEGALRGAPMVAGVLLAVSAALCVALRRKVFLFAAAIFLGALLTGVAMRVPVAETIKAASVEARVVSVRGEGEMHERFVLDQVWINGERYSYKVDAYAYGGVRVGPGDSVEFTGTLYPASERKNPGGTDEALALWKDGIALCTSVSADSLSVTGAASPVMSFFPRLRSTLGDRIEGLFPNSAGLVKALCIGVRDSLPSELKSDFREMGVSHLLAISGLHVECLALFLDFLLRRLRVSKKASFFAVLAFFAFYMCLVGFTASIVRATVMYVMLRGAPLMGRPSDGMTRLSAAFLLLVLIKPLNVFDYGFVLSFSAVAGLMLLMPRLNTLLDFKPDKRESRMWATLKKLLRRIAALASVSLIAQLATLPAVASYYGSISPWSVLVNLAAVPISMAALPLSLIAITANYVYFPLGALIAWAPDHLFVLLSRIVSAMTALPLSTVSLPAWPGWLTALYAAAFVLLSRYVDAPRPARFAALAAVPVLIACTFALSSLSLPDGLTMVFLSAGNSDATVVFAERSVYLMDAGDTDSPVADYLSYLGIGVIDGVFLSHPHKDHVAGLSRALDQARVSTLYLSENFFEIESDERVSAAIEKARELGTQIVLLKEGDELELSQNVSLTVVQADESGRNQADDLSMVAHIKYADGSALFLADLPMEREKLPMPDADVLKVAHHGSAYNTSEQLVMSTTPSVSVIPVGANSYGHPSEKILGRLRRSGSAVYRTDECGAVTVSIRTDGSVYVETFLLSEDQGA